MGSRNGRRNGGGNRNGAHRPPQRDDLVIRPGQTEEVILAAARTNRAEMERELAEVEYLLEVQEHMDDLDDEPVCRGLLAMRDALRSGLSQNRPLLAYALVRRGKERLVQHQNALDNLRKAMGVVVEFEATGKIPEGEGEGEQKSEIPGA